MATIAKVSDVRAAAKRVGKDAFDIFGMNHLNPRKSPDPRQYDQFIEQRGVSLEYWPHVPCPCVRPDTMEPAISCVSCGGTGRYYPEAKRTRVRALMTGRTPNHQAMAPGYLVTGTVRFAWPRGFVAGDKDLVYPQIYDERQGVWVPAERHSVQERLIRASNQPDAGAVYRRSVAPGQAPERGKARQERVKYSVVLEVSGLYWQHTETGAIVTRSANDISISGGIVTWRDGCGPPGGSVYTIDYWAPAAYILGEFSHRQLGDLVLPGSSSGVRYDQWDPVSDSQREAGATSDIEGDDMTGGWS